MGEPTGEDEKKKEEDLAVLVDLGYERVVAERLLEKNNLENAIKLLSAS